MSKSGLSQSTPTRVLRATFAILALPLGYVFVTGSLNLIFGVHIGVSVRHILEGLVGLAVAGTVLFLGYKAGQLPTRRLIPKLAYYVAFFLPVVVVWVPDVLWNPVTQSFSFMSVGLCVALALLIGALWWKRRKTAGP